MFMAKELLIRKLAAGPLEPGMIPALFKKESVAYNPIDTVNWPAQFPAKPEAEFAIAHNSESLLIHYRVTEDSVRAVGGNDRDHMWEDSCVEFFCAPGEAGDDRYYNFETNCIGRMYCCLGPNRNEREFVPEKSYEAVKRWASLGNEPFEERLEPTSWELALVIPASAMFAHTLKSFDGASLRGNFYKCGDLLSTVAFLSWSPIDLPSPNFHCPEFFGKLKCE